MRDDFDPPERLSRYADPYRRRAYRADRDPANQPSAREDFGFTGTTDINLDDKGDVKPPFTKEIASAFREYDRRIKWRYNAEKQRYEIVAYGLDDAERAKLTRCMVEISKARGVFAPPKRKVENLPSLSDRKLILDFD